MWGAANTKAELSTVESDWWFYKAVEVSGTCVRLPGWSLTQTIRSVRIGILRSLFGLAIAQTEVFAQWFAQRKADLICDFAYTLAYPYACFSIEFHSAFSCEKGKQMGVARRPVSSHVLARVFKSERSDWSRVINTDAEKNCLVPDEIALEWSDWKKRFQYLRIRHRRNNQIPNNNIVSVTNGCISN